MRQSDSILEEDVEQAISMIRKAQKPFIFVGGGAVISNASEELRAFAKKIQAPVADSLMGKGAYDGTDELYTGMVGMHGTKTSNFGITEADLLIVVGARFSDRVTGNASKFAKNAKILQIDIDRAEDVYKRQGKVFADLNFELPAHAHGPKDGVRCTYEYASFMEEFVRCV